jgi:hypothetical protein
MIGTKGSYYRVEQAISDPRQRDIWWRDVGEEYKYRTDAVSAARRIKNERVRVISVTEECVWANSAALVANGDKVT